MFDLRVIVVVLVVIASPLMPLPLLWRPELLPLTPPPPPAALERASEASNDKSRPRPIASAGIVVSTGVASNVDNSARREAIKLRRADALAVASAVAMTAYLQTAS